MNGKSGTKESEVSMLDAKALVIQANKLIMSNQKISTEAKRFMVALCSKVNPYDEDFKSYRLTFEEYASFTGIDKKEVINTLPKITKSLISQVIEYDDGESLFQWAILCKAQHRRNLGDVIVQFHPDLKPMYLELEKHFTKYKLENVLFMRGKHSIRIYEIIKSESFKGKKILDVAWINIPQMVLDTEPQFKKFPNLQKILGTDYKKFPDFEKYVLKPAQAEMKLHSDVCFEYDKKPLKRGRYICGIRFFIKDNIPTADHNQISLFDIVPKNENNIKTPAERAVEVEKAINDLDRGHLCREFQKAVKREYGFDFPLGLLEGVDNLKIAELLPCVGDLGIKLRSSEAAVLKYIKKVLNG
jgi:plasmid replication initiation protein